MLKRISLQKMNPYTTVQNWGELALKVWFGLLSSDFLWGK